MTKMLQLFTTTSHNKLEKYLISFSPSNFAVSIIFVFCSLFPCCSFFCRLSLVELVGWNSENEAPKNQIYKKKNTLNHKHTSNYS